MTLDKCATKHRCADGHEGECSQLSGHFGKHLCYTCLAFFSDSEAVGCAQRHHSVESEIGDRAQLRDPMAPVHALPRTDMPSRPPESSDARLEESRVVPQFRESPQGQFEWAGVWRSQVQTTYGIMNTELILEPTNKFSQQAFLNNYMTYDVGTYQVGEGFLHFVVGDHEPKVYLGKPLTWVTSWTYFYTVVDQDTVIFEDRVIRSKWTVYRS
jgi:hypothetical protein